MCPLGATRSCGSKSMSKIPTTITLTTMITLVNIVIIIMIIDHCDDDYDADGYTDNYDYFGEYHRYEVCRKLEFNIS